MIFVTVGSIHFDTLIRTVDEASASGAIKDQVILQIANGEYVPKHCEYFRTAPGLENYYSRADLVIGHGGTGTTLEVLERGLRLISVSNPSMIDNHQHEFLQALEGKGLLLYCRALHELSQFVDEAMKRTPPNPFNSRLFFRTVIDDLEALQ